MSSLLIIFRAILIALVSVTFMAWIGTRLAWRIQLVDYPESEPHKKHDYPTAMAGGLVLMVALWLLAWLLGLLEDVNVRTALWAGLPILLFGVWDDFNSLPPWLKLIGQVLATVILIYMGVSIKVFEARQFFIRGEGGIYQLMDWAVTLFWVVGLTNAFNFVDSMDGLAVGLGGTAAAFFMLVTLEAGQPALAQFSALLLGACIGLYLFNAPPASLFLGDSGAQTLGFILAVVAIGYRPQGTEQTSSWYAPILLLGVPIFDMCLVVISRLRRHHPVYSAALDHTYHRLLRLGLPSSRAVLIMQVAALALSLVAIIGLHEIPLIANAIFIGVLLVGGWVLAYLDRRKIWP
jgi:UDP-GlcNAc:undecaprenyl-phosphate/decaprenyl-phosphate GlcNAc-1-phosphate transferase